MIVASDIQSLSAMLNFTLYLYKKGEENILMFNNAISKTSPIPAFFKDMIEKNQHRKIIEKDGVKFAYHYFPLADDSMLFFQDTLDDARIAEMLLVASNLENDREELHEPDDEDELNDDDDDDTTDAHVYKRALIASKAERVKLFQELRKRENILGQYRSKLEYLANDLIMTQKLLHEQSDIITSLKATSTEYYAQIKKLNTGVDISNFNKLKEVNNALRQELMKAQFMAKASEDLSSKLKRNSLQALTELVRILKNDTISKMDVEIIANILAKNEQLQVKENSKQSTEMFGNVNLKSAINIMNNAIQNNNLTDINLKLLATVLPLDIEEATREPATALSSAVGKIINMAKTKAITQKQVDVLCAATNLYKS